MVLLRLPQPLLVELQVQLLQQRLPPLKAHHLLRQQLFLLDLLVAQQLQV
jgi:hypothetical protein